MVTTPHITHLRDGSTFFTCDTCVRNGLLLRSIGTRLDGAHGEGQEGE